MQCTGTWYTKTLSRRSLTTLRATNISCIGVSPILALQLWKNFLIRNSKNMKMIRNLITVKWDTTDRAILTTFAASYEEYKETLIDFINDLTRHSYIPKLKIASSWYRTKSKATTGVRNTASYISWLYTAWKQMGASKMIYCVLVLMTTNITQTFWITFKQC